MRLLDNILFHRIAPLQVRYLEPLNYRRAYGLARAALGQMERDFVVGPPVTVHLSNPQLMTGVWSAARECLAAGRGRRSLGEVVAAAVSRLNTCPYCLDIHSSMLHSHGFPDETEAAPIRDWGAATLRPGSEILAIPPFAAHELPLMAGTALCFHYLNRMANVFLEGSPLLVSGDGWMKDVVTRVSGRVLRGRLANQIIVPGDFLNAAPDVPLPAEFAWAAPDPHIAGGFLRLIAAAGEAGIESVDARVRETIEEHVGRWRGETPELGRAWLEEAVARLGPDLRPAARLALMTARASWQVDEGLVSDFRSHQPLDRDLINLTSWASCVAMRRIASWISGG